MDLQILWFILIAVLFIGYFVLEGFDFGVGMALPLLGRTDKRRRVMINTIGPVWDGNEVWLLTAGGAMFAAFPDWYATLFSGAYIPLLLILVCLIFRACAFEFRGKINGAAWRARWDVAIIAGSFLTVFLWGVAFANVVRGLAIDGNKHVTGSWLDLLNPYGLLGGVVLTALCLFHGLVFISLKTLGDVRVDARKLAVKLFPVVLVGGAAFLLWTQLAYGKAWTWLLIAAIVGALLLALIGTLKVREGWAFIGTASAVALAVAFLFACLFPNVLPSTLDPANSLTVAGNSSSNYTLVVMTIAAAILTPIVIAYQSWTYWVFRHRIGEDHIPAHIGLPQLAMKKSFLSLDA